MKRSIFLLTAILLLIVFIFAVQGASDTTATTLTAPITIAQATVPPKPTAPVKLTKVRWAVATSSVSPIAINVFVGEYLGYYAQEGLTLEVLFLGSNPAVQAALDKGVTEIGVGVPSFQLPMAARGEKVPGIYFYEYTYPFKWDWVVKENSPITEVSQLKGKKVGVGAFGLSDYPVGKATLKLAGLDPEKDVKWIAVGASVPGGAALDRGEIDALFHWDTGFGLIEAAGIKIRYLPRPKGLPMVGGLFFAATQDLIDKRPEIAIGIGRATAKGTVFCLENPQACAYAFLQMYPEVAPKGKSLTEQIKIVCDVFQKRATIWKHYDPREKKWGYISESELWEELPFAGLEGKIKNVKPFFTNKLIDEINNFDQEAIKKQAREFKIPEK